VQVLGEELEVWWDPEGNDVNGEGPGYSDTTPIAKFWWRQKLQRRFTRRRHKVTTPKCDHNHNHNHNHLF
jgi:hypothetical protein